MRPVSCTSFLVLGAGLAVDALPANPTLSLAPFPTDDATNSTPIWSDATKIESNGTRVNIGNVSSPVYIQNGTVVNDTSIEIELFDDIPIIPDKLGWVTNFPGPDSWSKDTNLTVNYFEEGNSSVSGPEQVKEIPTMEEEVDGRQSIISKEDDVRPGYRDRITVEAYDYRRQPTQAAIHQGLQPQTMDPNQFPGLSSDPIPMRRRPDPGTGRREGGNTRRPNNSFLHDNLGVEFPRGTSDRDGRNARKTTDEDVEPASRVPYYPADTSRKAPRAHAFVEDTDDHPEQRRQAKMTRVAPMNEPIYESIENLPTDKTGRDNLDTDIRHARRNAWDYDDNRPETHKEKYKRVDPDADKRRRRH